MEQLPQSTLQKLLADARERVDATKPTEAGAPATDGMRRNWIDPRPATHGAGRRHQAEQAVMNAADFASPGTVERRIVRRAEALWRRLSADGSLPSADRLGELLHLAKNSKALLVETPSGAPARIGFVGERLSALTGLTSGLLPNAALRANMLGNQLIALAQRSAQVRSICQYESGSDDDKNTDNSLSSNRRRNLQLLMRAVALPFAAHDNPCRVGATVVIASWRRLLSTEETRALHRELQAAMDWIERQGFKN